MITGTYIEKPKSNEDLVNQINMAISNIVDSVNRELANIATQNTSNE